MNRRREPDRSNPSSAYVNNGETTRVQGVVLKSIRTFTESLLYFMCCANVEVNVQGARCFDKPKCNGMKQLHEIGTNWIASQM
jgi:hypothetical protein